MITQTNVQGPESNSSDVIKDMSPQTNIQTPSFEDDEFDIPQVALAQEAGEKMGGNQQQSQHPYHPQQHHYHEAYYQQQPQQQQQWMGDYSSQMNYHHYQQQHQYQHGYAGQQPHYGGYAGGYPEDPGYHHMGHTGPLVTPGPGRSPSGSHSTPSPHSQTDSGIGTDLGVSDLHFSDLKRPHPGPESIPHQQCVAKKPKPSRRKKKRDPHEPQKPVSAYALFFRDRQASIKGRNPNLSFGEVSKLVAGFWDGLDPESKTHYKKRQELAKKEYLRQLAAYRASSLSKGHGEDMYGYMPGYPNTGYHMEAGGHPGIGQNIPPHPHPGHHLPHQHPHQPQHPHLGPGAAATFVTNSQDYLNQQTTAHHGTDPISAGPTGNSIPSLPAVTVCTPVSSHPHFHPPPGSEYPEDSGASLAPHDRNHNTMSGKCQRPGCANSVTKAEDGTMSTYCSSECVVGQCRDAYQGWEQQQHHTIIRPPPQQQTTVPHPSSVK